MGWKADLVVGFSLKGSLSSGRESSDLSMTPDWGRANAIEGKGSNESAIGRNDDRHICLGGGRTGGVVSSGKSGRGTGSTERKGSHLRTR
jgi:hypothetical protein